MRRISLLIADVDGTLVTEQKVLTERAQATNASKESRTSSIKSRTCFIEISPAVLSCAGLRLVFPRAVTGCDAITPGGLAKASGLPRRRRAIPRLFSINHSCFPVQGDSKADLKGDLFVRFLKILHPASRHFNRVRA